MHCTPTTSQSLRPPLQTRSGRLRSLDSISKRQESSSGTGDDKTTEAAAEVMTTTSTTASPVTVPIADVLPTASAISIVSPSNLSVPSKAGKTGDDKVSKSQFPSEEICVTDRSWEQINETNDFYDNKVEIVQEEGLQQFVFTYRCANMKGITHRNGVHDYSTCLIALPLYLFHLSLVPLSPVAPSCMHRSFAILPLGMHGEIWLDLHVLSQITQ